MTTDNLTSLSGAIVVIGGGIAAFFPPEYGVGITKIALGISLLAGLFFAYFTNKADAPPPPPDPAKIKELADQLQAMINQLNTQVK